MMEPSWPGSEVKCFSFMCGGCSNTVVVKQQAVRTKVKWPCAECRTWNRFEVPGHSEEDSPW